IPAARNTTAKPGFPVKRMSGTIRSTSEDDVAPAGAAGKGYTSITTHPSGTDFPVLQDIQKYVVNKGLGNLQDAKRFGNVYYNLGVVNGILNVEAIRTAQARFGNRPLTGEEVRWGFENLNIDDARLEQLGAKGLLQRIKLSCEDHEGGGAV